MKEREDEGAEDFSGHLADAKKENMLRSLKTSLCEIKTD